MSAKRLSASALRRALAVGRTARRRLALLALAAALAAPLAAAAQPPPFSPAPPAPTKFYWNKKSFSLPVQIDDRNRANLAEVQLYVKDHPTHPWVCCEKGRPSQNAFSFRPLQDGEYWFVVVTVDKQGRATPPDLNAPGVSIMVVVIDTRAPQIELLPQAPVGAGQVVECKVIDANPDPSKTHFEYQTWDRKWRAAEPVADRQELYLIPSQARTTGLVRVTVCDLAKNPNVREANLASTTVPLVHNAAAPMPPALRTGNGTPPLVYNLPTPPVALEHSGSSAPGKAPEAPVAVNPQAPSGPPLLPNIGEAHVAASPGVVTTGHTEPAPAVKALGGSVTTPNCKAPGACHLVGHSRLALEYQVENVGPSGIGKVEVYITNDRGRSWQRLCEDADRKSPVEIELTGEGLFGVSLVVSNGRGVGDGPPRSGDTPDWWIEVDKTRPAATLTSVQAGGDGKAVAIQWEARDKNLGERPVDLYFAASLQGPWTPIVRGLKNDGSYNWCLPPQVSGQVYVQLVVTDQAGNICQCETPTPVMLDDQTRPRAHVINVVQPTPHGN